MEIKGEIEEFIYQNEVNGYTIASLKTDKDLITVVGYLPFVNTHDMLKLQGQMVVHKEYGEQFKIETFEKILPEGLPALEKYLCNGTIRGIGKATARKIIEEFGEDTVYVFKNESQRLTKIKGITIQKAEQMAEDFNENWELWRLVSFLDKFGIGIESIRSIQKKLGADAKEQIENNPYILVDLASNVDFKKIDKIAIEIGFAETNKKRIESGIKYSLKKINVNGHTTTLKENLILFVQDFLNISRDDVENSIIDLKVKNKIVIENRDDAEWVYLSEFYNAEQTIAEKLLKLKNNMNMKKIANFENKLKKMEEHLNLQLSEKQKEAVCAINENNVCVITGGPGTGKTTIIKMMLEIFMQEGKKAALCAPTGRAAKRMTEVTGKEAKTLHRLLEIGKIGDNAENEGINVTPIDADIIIVDEMSMVDTFLMNYFVKAVYQGTKLVLVGDVDQLPSVGPGSVLKDIIESGEFTTIVLNEIFRQAAQSKIIVNAHNVNKGKTFIKEKTEGEKEDFFYIKEGVQEKILYHVISLSKERLKNYGGYDFFENIQILTPTKKGMLGTKELNKALQEALNPPKPGAPEKQSMRLYI